MSSSSGVDNACDVVQSPLIVLSDTSTLTMRLRYDIEPASGGQQWDRANISIYDVTTGQIVEIPEEYKAVFLGPGGIKEHAQQCLRNLQAKLNSEGSSLEKIVWASWSLRDPAEFETFNDWRAFMHAAGEQCTRPPWTSQSAYPFLTPGTNLVSSFLLERPNDEFARDARGYL